MYSLEQRQDVTRWRSLGDPRRCPLPLLVTSFLESQGDVVLGVRINDRRSWAVRVLEGSLPDMLLQTALAVLAVQRDEVDVCVWLAPSAHFPDSDSHGVFVLKLLSGPAPPYALSPPPLWSSLLCFSEH